MRMNTVLYYSLEYSQYISKCANVYRWYVVTEQEGNMNMGQYYSLKYS